MKHNPVKLWAFENGLSIKVKMTAFIPVGNVENVEMILCDRH